MTDQKNIKKRTRKALTQLPKDDTFIEHEIKYMDFWDNIKSSDIYTLINEKNKNKERFIITDGPPFLSGKPHIGHKGPNAGKAVIYMYKSMKGYNCSYILGYDCHGLPIENRVQKKHNLETLDQIKELGIAGFNKLCEEEIKECSQDAWKPMLKRYARLADFDNIYMTRDFNFMESCWWIFKELYNKGLVYKGNKVIPYSWKHETPLSNFEAAQNYKEKETKSIYVGFELCDHDQTYIVIWTTTPWTLPANMAVCVNKDLEYVKVEYNNKNYILGKNCVSNLFKEYKIIDTYKGSDLVGWTYKPLYPYFTAPKIHTILCDNYVSEGTVGTAIVHLAPAFGDDDFRVCSQNGIVNNINISEYCPIDTRGQYNIGEYKGRLVFDCEEDIRLSLKKSGHLIKTELYRHNYPYCWRSDTPLIYRTIGSYYINVVALKNRLIELNKTVKWSPREVGENRFHQWLSEVKDWSVSRSRCYGTPIPIWINEDGESLCVGSVDELEALSGKRVSNLHPEYVNDIEIIKDGKIFRRIPDIFDCWFESGAVPMAQLHYPFNEKSREIETREYLSDFVCEGIDQTRGWFYTLLVLSTAIFDKAPYKNVVCTGLVLDSQGQKMSKRLGNYIDSDEIINRHGADFVKTYLIHSPVMNAESLRFDEKEIERLKRRFIPYINAVRFLIEHTQNYMKVMKIEFLDITDLIMKEENYDYTLMDRWIITKTRKLINSINKKMDDLQFSLSIDELTEFIEDLTNWYIKLNRDRIKGLQGNDQWNLSLSVLYNVLLRYCQLLAPFMPFLSEHVYQHLKTCSKIHSKKESVLLTKYPELSQDIVIDDEVLVLVKDLQRLCTMTRSMRQDTKKHNQAGVPLKSCTIYHDNPEYLKTLEEYIGIIQSELNCKKFNFEGLGENSLIKVETDRRELGKLYRKDADKVKKMIEGESSEFLLRVLNGEDTFKYNGEVVDKKCYRLYKVPNPDMKTKDNSCLIDNDIMISIDITYDEEIHNECQIAKIHRNIQDARKKMGLHPWNKITVILDEKYANEEMCNALTARLTNAQVEIADFTEENIYRTTQGIIDDEKFIIYSMMMNIEKFDNSNIEGQLLVHYLK